MEDNIILSKLKAYLVPIIIMIVTGIILFLPAGSLRYWEAWIWWLEISALTFFITAYFLTKNPKLLSRRMKTKGKNNSRKVPAFLKLYYVGYLIPGFDFRFHWSAMPVSIIIAANCIVFLGYLFIMFVFMKNSYASTIIQVERQQQVITFGPYAIVRHPMYLGLLVMSLFTPFALGSFWAIIPFLLIIPTLVLRIEGEEEVLLRDLSGYKDYCGKTRYRLIPLIW
jgi:protein-S-isoprenylcysteine O-methyltransferase Ste14